MAEHTVDSIVNMMAVIEADMMYNRYGLYGALKQIDMVNTFHESSLQSNTLKTFESKFWERVRGFVEIKHPDFMGDTENPSIPNTYNDLGIEDFDL